MPNSDSNYIIYGPNKPTPGTGGILPHGPQGYQGYQGSVGAFGPQGYQGIRGYQGPKGDQGNVNVNYNYPQGYQGFQGFQGAIGFQGFQGFPGSQGDQGNVGPLSTTPGPQGLQGVVGLGYQGAIGTSGLGGPQGYQGIKGDKGDTGTQGSIGVGYQGDQGYQGQIGSSGTPGGPQGYQGNQGFLGYQGHQGEIGCAGPQGNQGFGYQGFQGFIGNPGTPGGPQGYQGNDSTVSGPQGYQGLTGGVSTVPGQQGVQGADGMHGYQGTQGSGGFQGFQGVTGGIGPQGYQGQIGVQGPTGFGNQGIPGDFGPQGYQGTTPQYVNINLVPTSVGGIGAGTTFVSALTMQQMFDLILYPYQNPYFVGFYINGQSTTLEAGAIVSGSEVFNWTSANSANINPNSIGITDLTNSVVLGSALANSGSFTVILPTAISRNTGSNIWQIKGTNTNSADFTANFAVSWYLRIYYGTSANAILSASDIVALAGSVLASGVGRTYSYSGGNYKYLALPNSFSTPSAFKDSSTLLSVAMADATDNSALSGMANGYSYATVTVTNSYGVATPYKLYRTKNMLGGSINIQVT